MGWTRTTNQVRKSIGEPLQKNCLIVGLGLCITLVETKPVRGFSLGEGVIIITWRYSPT